MHAARMELFEGLGIAAVAFQIGLALLVSLLARQGCHIILRIIGVFSNVDLATLEETNVASSIENRKKSPPSLSLPDDIIGDVIGSLGSLGSEVSPPPPPPPPPQNDGH